MPLIIIEGKPSRIFRRGTTSSRRAMRNYLHTTIMQTYKNLTSVISSISKYLFELIEIFISYMTFLEMNCNYEHMQVYIFMYDTPYNVSHI